MKIASMMEVKLSPRNISYLREFVDCFQENPFKHPYLASHSLVKYKGLIFDRNQVNIMLQYKSPHSRIRCNLIQFNPLDNGDGIEVVITGFPKNYTEVQYRTNDE